MTDSTAILDVVAERARQQSEEGWTVEHDDEHTHGGLAQAAACYAVHHTAMSFVVMNNWGDCWPWDDMWWKPSGARRNLVKAAALLIAEIERLDRLAVAIAP